jgi:hypothetical protein
VTGGAVGDDAGLASINGIVHRCRRSVDKTADPVASPRNRLKHIDRADDIDARAERRIGAYKRYLQRCQMDDARNGMIVECALKRLQIGNIAGNERHPRQFVVGHDQLQAAWIARQVEDDNRGFFTYQVAHRPRADTSKCAGDQKTVVGHGSPVLSSSACAALCAIIRRLDGRRAGVRRCGYFLEHLEPIRKTVTSSPVA